MINDKAVEVINRLEAMDKRGASYSGNGRHGYRNPIKSDVGLLLHSLVVAEKPKRILELGTGYGLSGCYLASGLQNGGELVTIEFDEDVAKEAQANFIAAGLPAKVYTGDVLDVIPQLNGRVGGTGAYPSKRFDCVFMDAEKKSYMRHFQALRDAGLLTLNCMIIADNVIDRASEMEDFRNFYINKCHMVFKTDAGLLVMKL